MKRDQKNKVDLLVTDSQLRFLERSKEITEKAHRIELTLSDIVVDILRIGFDPYKKYLNELEKKIKEREKAERKLKIKLVK